MILKCTSFENMKREVKEKNMSLAVFGAGVTGTVTTPEILAEYGMMEDIVCYLDNNPAIQKNGIMVREKFFLVKPADSLEYIEGNIAVIVAVSRYTEVLKQLELMACADRLWCYLMPMMCIHNFCCNASGGKAVLNRRPLIPKTIHYMWLGKKTLPYGLHKCIDSWKKYCPDYEVKRWYETNYNIEKHPYMKEAYESGAYGFVPDFARLDILYEYGGIYLDTDVELLRSLDPLLCQEAFCGVEKWQVINFGGCSGAIKNNSGKE